MLHFISSVALAVAGPLTDRVSYHAPDIPAGWAQGARATPDTHITLNFLLVQRNVELLEQTLEAEARHTDSETSSLAKVLASAAEASPCFAHRHTNKLAEGRHPCADGPVGAS